MQAAILLRQVFSELIEYLYDGQDTVQEDCYDTETYYEQTFVINYLMTNTYWCKFGAVSVQ